MNGKQRVFKGRVCVAVHYDSPKTNYLGRSVGSPYCKGHGRFTLTKFLDGLEGKKVKLVLEVLD